MKIIDIKKKTDFTHVNLFSADYLDKADHKRTWLFASRRNRPLAMEKVVAPDAVVIVPYHAAEKKLVMIKEFRVPLGDFQYGFPAGLVEKNDTVEATAARELHEETGLEITQFIRQSPVVYSSSGLTDESIVLVFVECAGVPDPRLASDAEEIEVILLSPEEAAAIRDGQATAFDVKSWLVVDRFAATGKI